ncbi:MAG: hypothetical protein U1F58_18270 [Burkholderiales bacterium]
MQSPRIAAWLLAGLLIASIAHAQTNVRIRGTITAVNGNVLAVATRDGRDVKLVLPDNVAVAVATAVRFDDIKEGDFVGTTTRPGPGGTEVATEVHYLAPTSAPGQSAWDGQPNSKMTNANVAGKVAGTGDRELTLRFPGGTQKVVVPEGIPIVRAVPGVRGDLAAGEYVFAVAQQGADGTLTAPRIQVSKNGVRPPQ